MVGHAGSSTGIVHADMTLTRSKVKISDLLKFQKLHIVYLLRYFGMTLTSNR